MNVDHRTDEPSLDPGTVDHGTVESFESCNLGLLITEILDPGTVGP